MKKREITSLSLLERDYKPCRSGKLSNFFTCQLFGTHEREAFSGSLDVGSAHADSAEDNEP